MAVILDFCPEQIARDKRIVRETAKKLGQVIIFPGVRIERQVNNNCSDSDAAGCNKEPLGEKR